MRNSKLFSGSEHPIWVDQVSLSRAEILRLAMLMNQYSVEISHLREMERFMEARRSGQVKNHE